MVTLVDSIQNLQVQSEHSIRILWQNDVGGMTHLENSIEALTEFGPTVGMKSTGASEES